ncbi:MAG: isocitrate/isopropylmalate family dehydrogenase, partial [Desulfobulbia bacterium]
SAMYEPVHGTAPDIAGQNKANPIAMIASFAMALRYSFSMGEAADLVEKSISNVLDQGLRTGDIMQDGMSAVSTSGMGDAIIAQLEALS